MKHLIITSVLLGMSTLLATQIAMADPIPGACNQPGVEYASSLKNCYFGKSLFVPSGAFEYIGAASLQTPNNQSCTVTNMSKKTAYIVYIGFQKVDNECRPLAQSALQTFPSGSSKTYSIPSCKSNYGSQYNGSVTFMRLNSNHRMWNPEPNIVSTGLKVTCTNSQ